VCLVEAGRQKSLTHPLTTGTFVQAYSTVFAPCSLLLCRVSHTPSLGPPGQAGEGGWFQGSTSRRPTDEKGVTKNGELHQVELKKGTFCELASIALTAQLRICLLMLPLTHFSDFRAVTLGDCCQPHVAGVRYTDRHLISLPHW
jgi:hypothetical protein